MKGESNKGGGSLTDFPVSVELDLICFTCNKLLKMSTTVKCIKAGWWPYTTQEAVCLVVKDTGKDPRGTSVNLPLLGG